MILRLWVSLLVSFLCIVILIRCFYFDRGEAFWEMFGYASPKLLSLECSRVSSQHPLSFELAMSACGQKGSMMALRTSDGVIVNHSELIESSPLLEEKLQFYLKNTYQILDRQQIFNPQNGQVQLRIIGVFNIYEQKPLVFSIITVSNTKLNIISASSLWHAQQLEYELNHN